MSSKTILFLIFQVLQITSIQAQRQPDVVKIEFSTMTRGAHESVWITKDSVRIEKKTMSSEAELKSGRRLKPKEWTNILNTLENVSLQDIPALKSPTKDRAFDGAYHSNIVITTKGGQSFTHSFDNEDPNEKLQLLMLAIRKTTQFNKP